MINIKLIALLAIYISCINNLAIAINLDQQHMQAIGKQIWQNECRGTIAGLTSWNEGEEFASLGIGHFIWYPQKQKKLFQQTFPALISYLKKHHTKLPKWLEHCMETGCPWATREDFLAAQNSKKMQQLRTLLTNTIDLQTLFIMQRIKKTLHVIQKKVSSNTWLHIKKQLERLTKTPNGIYALIDYVHFKGEGVNTQEKYSGHGWGLIQVLEHMQGKQKGIQAVKDFCNAAKEILTKRVEHAPIERNEARWLVGWHNRINSYLTLSFDHAKIASAKD